MDMSPVLAAAAAPLSTTRWQDRAWVAYALFATAGILLVLPSLLGPSMLYDSFAISWVWADQFTAEIARGNPYPRWLPLSNSGLGSPVFYYYPPLAFYLTAAFGLLGFTTYGSIVAAFASAFALSGITAWHWLRECSKQPILGALMFMAAPYHLFDYTWRGALAESLAIALIPLVALGLRRIAEGRGMALAAVAYAAIILAHLPLALLVSVMLVAPYALRHHRRLASFATAIVLGIGLAAIYLLPALALEQFREVDKLYATSLRTPSYWTPWSADFTVGFVVMLYLTMAALAALAVVLVARHRDRWAAGALAVLLVSAGLAPFFWSLPLLPKVQFPYRALPIAEFFLVTALARIAIRSWVLAALIPLTLLSAAFLRQVTANTGWTVARLQAEHPDVSEYLPRGVIALDDWTTKPRDLAKTLLPPPQVPGKVVAPVFYFPAWSCGEPHPRTRLLMHDPSCTPRIVWTREEWLGACVSLLSLLVVAALALTRGAATARLIRSFKAPWSRNCEAKPRLQPKG